MSTSDNPFANPGRPPSPGDARWLILAWSAAAICLIAAVIMGMQWQNAAATLAERAKTFENRSEKAAGEIAALRATASTNQAALARARDRIAELEREKEFVGQQARSLEDEMRQQLESKDVTISKLQGKLTVTILDRVMFNSGEAVLQPDGEVVMQKIADLLATHPQLKIHVIGHTDNVPIRPAPHGRFSSNWELSTARALAAVHFLTQKAGVDPRRLGAVGYGEFRPIADNSTSEGRARNRRIAITILPDELVGPEPETSPAEPPRPQEDAGQPKRES